MTMANAVIMVANIEQALSRLDPANAAVYQANAKAYQTQLQELDAWVKAQINSIPPENRKLITDHDSLGYYVNHYGLELIGAIVPAYSANAEPSAQELASLEDEISKYKAKAIFVGTTVNPALAKQVADDTGVWLVSLYTGSSLQYPSGLSWCRLAGQSRQRGRNLYRLHQAQHPGYC